MTLQPTVLSSAGSHLLCTRQGFEVRRISSCEAKGQGGDVTSISPISLDTEHFFVIAFGSSCRLFTITGQSVEPSNRLLLNESIVTSGLVRFGWSARDSNILQIGSKALYKITRKEAPRQLTEIEPGSLFAFSLRQLVLASKSHVVLRAFSDREMAKDEWDSKEYDITAIDLSLQNEDGDSEMIAYGLVDPDKRCFVGIHKLSLDRAERTWRIMQELPCRIACLKYLKNRVLVGLENGFLFCGALNFDAACIYSIQTFQLGIRAVSLSYFRQDSVKSVYFGLSSRSWLIYVDEFCVEVTPLVMDAMDVACGIPGHDDMFLSANKRVLSVNRVTSLTPTDLFVSRINCYGDVTGICPLDGSQYVVVSGRDGLFLVNMINMSVQLIEMFKGELVLMSNRSRDIYADGYLIAVLSKTAQVSRNQKDRKYIIRLFGAMMGRESVVDVKLIAMKASDFLIHIVAPVSYAKESVNMRPSVVAMSGPNLLLYRVDGSSLHLAAQYSGIGTTVRSMAVFDLGSAKGYGIWIGDQPTGVKYLEFEEERKLFEPKYEEGYARPVSFLDSYGLDVCGGDRLGNIFALGLPDHHTLGGKGRLSLKINFCVGDMISTVCRTSDSVGMIWYQTMSGAFGGILDPSSLQSSGVDHWQRNWGERVMILRRLEMVMTELLLKLCKMDLLALRNKEFPMTSVTDLDVCELYFGLSEGRRGAVLAKVNSMHNIGTETRPVTHEWLMIEFVRLRRYFLMWGMEQ
jgi:hypothetical protein